MRRALVASLFLAACGSPATPFLKLPHLAEHRSLVVVWRSGVPLGGQVFDLDDSGLGQERIQLESTEPFDVEALLYELPLSFLQLSPGKIELAGEGSTFPPGPSHLFLHLDQDLEDELSWVDRGQTEAPLADLHPVLPRSHDLDLGFVAYETLAPLKDLEVCLSGPDGERCATLPEGRLRARLGHDVRHTLRLPASGGIGAVLAFALESPFSAQLPLLRSDSVDRILASAGLSTIRGRGHVYFQLTGDASAVRSTRVLPGGPATVVYFDSDGMPDPTLIATSREGSGVLLNLEPGERPLLFSNAASSTCSPDVGNWVPDEDPRTLIAPIIADHVTFLGGVSCVR